MSKVRVDQLTLGELALVEKRSGQSISALADTGTPKVGLMMWLAYVIKKREDPDYTPEQAADLTLDAIGDLLDTGDTDPDPTSGAQPSA